jgi:hypothetical protein
MATHLRENTSIQVIADICDGTAAALAADPQAAPLVTTWTAITSNADALAAERRTLERAARRARARLLVRDAVWDSTAAAFGRAVVDASNGRRDRAPYTRFFAKTVPSAAQAFGTQREIDIARAWIAELDRSAEEPLAKAWATKLTEATDALQNAFAERNDAVKALGLQHTAVTLFLDEVNREVDRLEGDLKKVFAGEADRVGSYLAAFRPSRSRRDRAARGRKRRSAPESGAASSRAEAYPHRIARSSASTTSASTSSPASASAMEASSSRSSAARSSSSR